MVTVAERPTVVLKPSPVVPARRPRPQRTVANTYSPVNLLIDRGDRIQIVTRDCVGEGVFDRWLRVVGVGSGSFKVAVTDERSLYSVPLSCVIAHQKSLYPVSSIVTLYKIYTTIVSVLSHLTVVCASPLAVDLWKTKLVQLEHLCGDVGLSYRSLWDEYDEDGNPVEWWKGGK